MSLKCVLNVVVTHQEAKSTVRTRAGSNRSVGQRSVGHGPGTGPDCARQRPGYGQTWLERGSIAARWKGRDALHETNGLQEDGVPGLYPAEDVGKSGLG